METTRLKLQWDPKLYHIVKEHAEKLGPAVVYT